MKHFKEFKVNESSSYDKDDAKILRDNFGEKLSPYEFGEYVWDYFENPESYGIDKESDYYEALNSVYYDIRDTSGMSDTWNEKSVKACSVYKEYKKLK